MSFLEKEEGKQSPFWDWFLGIGLLALVAGFTLYYQYQKRATQSRFRAANVLFQSGDLAAAALAYEELKEASYLTAANDSVIYERLDAVEEAQEKAREAVARARTKLAAGDKVGAREDLGAVEHPGLLGERDRRWADSAKASLDAL